MIIPACSTRITYHQITIFECFKIINSNPNVIIGVLLKSKLKKVIYQDDKISFERGLVTFEIATGQNTGKTKRVHLPNQQVMLYIRKSVVSSMKIKLFEIVITNGIATSSWCRWYLNC